MKQKSSWLVVLAVLVLVLVMLGFSLASADDPRDKYGFAFNATLYSGVDEKSPYAILSSMLPVGFRVDTSYESYPVYVAENSVPLYLSPDEHEYNLAFGGDPYFFESNWQNACPVIFEFWENDQFGGFRVHNKSAVPFRVSWQEGVWVAVASGTGHSDLLNSPDYDDVYVQIADGQGGWNHCVLVNIQHNKVRGHFANYAIVADKAEIPVNGLVAFGLAPQPTGDYFVMWDYGDGRLDSGWGNVGNTHMFLSSGIYKVKATVCYDSDGNREGPYDWCVYANPPVEVTVVGHTLTPTPTATSTPMPTPLLHGWVFFDRNRNGFRDLEEKDGPSGVEVQLKDSTGQVALWTKSVCDTGWYEFEPVLKGEYELDLTLPDGFETTTSERVGVEVPRGEVVNFGIVPIIPTPTPTPTATPTVKRPLRPIKDLPTTPTP
ncbi:MAG: SdrD B-like domain-containing protein [Patescibacteria group bacterium]